MSAWSKQQQLMVGGDCGQRVKFVTVARSPAFRYDDGIEENTGRREAHPVPTQRCVGGVCFFWRPGRRNRA